MSISKRNNNWLGLAAVALLAPTIGCQESGSTGNGGGPINNVAGTFYADTGWNGTHAGPRNDDFANIDLPRGFREAWNGAEDAALLQGVGIGIDGDTFLVPSGYGPDKSNLTAYDLDGNIQWASPPWTDASGFDSCAVFSSTIVDLEGDIYIGDCNQLWAFHPNGDVKWIVDLPLAPTGSPFQDITAGPVNAITQAFFTKEGAIGGITLYGDVFIVSRKNGSPQYEPFVLPGVVSGDVIPLPSPSTYQGTMDDELRVVAWNWLFATDAFITADTPAVSSTTGRVFASAKGSSGGNSMIALDLVPGTGGDLGTVSIAWESSLDLTGGSSPALAPDESAVYAGTGEGYIRAFDVNTGDELWNVFNPEAAAGSVAVGPEGRVFSIPSTGTAINGDGTISWLTTDQLDSLTEGLPVSPTLGAPLVASSSIIGVIGDKIMQYVTVSYDLSSVITSPFPAPVLPAPVKSFLVTRDRTTGELVKGSVPFEGRTSLENLNTAHRSGRVMISYGALISSNLEAFAGLIDMFLPPGVSLLPNDPGAQVVEGIDEVTFGDLVDGVIDSGDFVVNLDAGRQQDAVTGSAEIGTATVEIDVQSTGTGFEGNLTIRDEDRGVEGTLQINDESIDTGLGPHAAGGMASGTLNTADGASEVAIAWLVKDWS